MPVTKNSFEIYPFSIINLKNILADKSDAPAETIEAKSHSQYFFDYLAHLGANTILVENNYIDRDFLEDFSEFYVRCFHDYGRKCTRLHFFKLPFTKDDFNSLLDKEPSIIDENNLNECYLGFIVVKPLPRTIFGRTCLKTYDSDGGRRNYPTTREYDIHLFGLKLKIDSLAFQEQDRVVAACATSALWSVFHRTGILFHHPILSPVDITKAACEPLPLVTRTFPNIGLTDYQMAVAIRKVTLEPFIVKAIDQNVLRSTIYAYINIGVPIVMSIYLYNFSGPQPVYVDRHAVAITGFSLDNASPPIPLGPNKFLMKSTKINEIYAHDDQVGPFAKMVLNQGIANIKIDNIDRHVDTISTNMMGGNIKAVPDTILIPLYHKIRINFSSIQEVVSLLDGYLEVMRNSGAFHLPTQLEWDIYLTETNKLKENLLVSPFLDKDERRKILLENLPRFVWRATASCGDIPQLDLIFDATDIEQGLCLTRAIKYNNDIFNFLLTSSRNPAAKTSPIFKILKWFATI